jgi:hypothetical protein
MIRIQTNRYFEKAFCTHSKCGSKVSMCVYIDGSFILKLDHAHQKRLDDILYRQQDIDIELSEFERHPTVSQRIKITRMAPEIFRFTDYLKRSCTEM